MSLFRQGEACWLSLLPRLNTAVSKLCTQWALDFCPSKLFSPSRNSLPAACEMQQHHAVCTHASASSGASCCLRSAAPDLSCPWVPLWPVPVAYAPARAQSSHPFRYLRAKIQIANENWNRHFPRTWFTELFLPTERKGITEREGWEIELCKWERRSTGERIPCLLSCPFCWRPPPGTFGAGCGIPPVLRNSLNTENRHMLGLGANG